jgi:hypothetical protein
MRVDERAYDSQHLNPEIEKRCAHHQQGGRSDGLGHSTTCAFLHIRTGSLYGSVRTHVLVQGRHAVRSDNQRTFLRELIQRVGIGLLAGANEHILIDLPRTVTIHSSGGATSSLTTGHCNHGFRSHDTDFKLNLGQGRKHLAQQVAREE